MKIYPVEFEVVDEMDDIFAKFTAFDEESFEVDVKKKILSPDDLRIIADKLEFAQKMMKDGIND